MMGYEFSLMKERIDALSGASSKTAAGLRAVRIEDVQPLLQFPANPKSAKAGGASPTKAEFDALVDDVHKIWTFLAAQSMALQDRSKP